MLEGTALQLDAPETPLLELIIEPSPEDETEPEEVDDVADSFEFECERGGGEAGTWDVDACLEIMITGKVLNRFEVASSNWSDG